ncbi:MAG TPA: type I glyceraldehyde-3-phosphate dehydrogenase [Anaerolineales bacterium]|nr:type I glyceraldehyde-3-phosphate dehydrogenase [Anaerolineales bacterium]
MTTRIGINGFGRVGRQVLKAALEKHPAELEVAAINDLFDAATNAHLFKYDSNYGTYPGKVEARDGHLVVDGRSLRVFSEKDPGQLPWKDLGVDIVIESTGVFTDAKAKGDKPGAAVHIEKGGARKVIISAPAKNEDLTLVLGVNDTDYDPKKHHILSNASCTTNCLAPVAKVVHDTLRIRRGLMTTVHAYTNDQRILDLAHKDLRRARAAGLNIIPTTTGAARALAKVIPDLEGKFDGFSLRVPTATVSVVDFVVEVERATTIDELNQAFDKASAGPMKGILGITREPLVSSDFKGDDRSAIVDGLLTMVMGGTMVKVVAWYDNEWGYSVRTADLAALLAKSL